MYKVLLAIYILVCIFLIAIILMQRSSTTMANFSSSQGSKHRADSNFITKATGVAGGLFMIISLLLCKLMVPPSIVNHKAQEDRSPNKASIVSNKK